MKKPLRCLLLDDELPGLTYLKMLCEQLPELDIVKAYADPYLLMQEASGMAFDICILDIEMAGIDGLSVARSLPGKPVIFTTAYKQYAADAFDIDAVDYLVKPIRKERLQQAIGKVVKRLESGQQYPAFIPINTDKGKAMLFFDSVVYVCTSPIDSRDKVAILADGAKMTLKNISFDKLLSLLPPDGFCQINKQQIVALQAVRFFAHDVITTSFHTPSGFLTLQLNEAYRNAFMRKTLR